MSDSGLSARLLDLLRCPCPEHAELTYSPTEGEHSPAGREHYPAGREHSPAEAEHSPTGREHSPAGGELTCAECGRAFPIRDGIPVMLLDEARSPGD